MARGSALASLAVIVVLANQCFAQSSKAKNIIIFMGDGTGVSSLNAASIYGYDKPQSLYIQSFSGVALADTSTATQWVTDGGAGATAIATGVKTNSGVLSESSAAIKDQQDGEILKTFFEYAREHGFSTGAISNDDRQDYLSGLAGGRAYRRGGPGDGDRTWFRASPGIHFKYLRVSHPDGRSRLAEDH